MNEVTARSLQSSSSRLGVRAGWIYRWSPARSQQFAATIAISVTVSGFVALTLSPALCGVVSRRSTGNGAVLDLFDRVFSRTQQGYATRSLRS